MTRRRRRSKTVPAVRPNAGLEAAYRRKLDVMVRGMCAEVEDDLHALYKSDPPVMAQDATPSKELQKAIAALAKKWQHRFDDSAGELAKFFAKNATSRSDAAMRSILKRGGWSVEFKMTAAMRDVLEATTAANVALIKSIPEKYFGEVEGIVMRSAQVGRDLSTATNEIESRYGVTRSRAAFIARDQNNKATAAMTRARQTELGIRKAVWLHSAGGKEPRPTHVKNSGKVYDIEKGWYDPAVKRYIWPGTEPGCRCVSKSVIEGFS